jgi:DNA-binding NtrC family response regulator
MPSGNPKLTALWVLEPEEAAEVVSNALRNNDGNVTAAAEELGVGRASLYRWMEEHPILNRVRAKAEHDAKEQAKREGRVG